MQSNTQKYNLGCLVMAKIRLPLHSTLHTCSSLSNAGARLTTKEKMVHLSSNHNHYVNWYYTSYIMLLYTKASFRSSVQYNQLKNIYGEAFHVMSLRTTYPH